MYKLIRDNIPKMAAEAGKPIDFAVVTNDDFYFRLLQAKLVEEMAEYNESPCAEEAADILTVLFAICKCAGITSEQINAAYSQKLAERGGFDARYIGLFEDEAK